MGQILKMKGGLSFLNRKFITLLVSHTLTSAVFAGGLEAADVAFREGRFADAEKLYGEVVGAANEPFEAVLRLGEIALYSNQLDRAEQRLRSAIQLRPDEKHPKLLLAEVHYRRDEFAQAAALLRDWGSPALADKLASFSEQKPYDLVMTDYITRVKFVSTDPLPVIEGKVNGNKPVYFVIDTGGAELILNTEYGKSVGAVSFGSELKLFAADQEASSEQARIDSFQLPGVEIRNVPVHLLDTSRFAVVAGGRRVDGVVGTILLNRFIFTFDYPAGQLVLRRRSSAASTEVRDLAQAAGAITIPYWMAGDHFMVAQGRVNGGEPRMLFVDTGLAGGGFLCPESMIQEAKISLGNASFDGIGGAGTVKVTPFMVDELSLGGVLQRNVPSFAGAFPSSLEYRFGFRIAGLVSHSFFRPFSVTFDPLSMRMYVEARPAPNP